MTRKMRPMTSIESWTVPEVQENVGARRTEAISRVANAPVVFRDSVVAEK